MINLKKKYSRIQHLVSKDIKNYSETMASMIMGALLDLLENEKKAKIYFHFREINC